jgi:hypothetical protein
MTETQQTLVVAVRGIETALVQLAQHVSQFDDALQGVLRGAYHDGGPQAQEAVRAIVSLDRLDKVIIGRLRDLGLDHVVEEVRRQSTPYTFPADWVEDWIVHLQRVVG